METPLAATNGMAAGEVALEYSPSPPPVAFKVVAPRAPASLPLSCASRALSLSRFCSNTLTLASSLSPSTSLYTTSTTTTMTAAGRRRGRP